MNAKYTRNLEITSSKVNMLHQLRHDAILNIFQDLATAHAYEMGMGFYDLKKSSNAFWVLSKIRFVKQGNILQGDNALLETWPLSPTPYRFVRDFQISSSNGKVLGSSEWCILDWDSKFPRKFSSVKYPSDLTHLETRSGAGDFSRLKVDVLDEDFNYEYKTVYTDIDCNGHVNNVAYSKMALNTFTPTEFDGFNFKAFEIHFISQTYFNDVIKIYKKMVDNGVFVSGMVGDKIVFKALFEY